MQELFVGRIVSWPNQFNEDDGERPVNLRFAGHGEIVAVLEMEQTYLLVRKLSMSDENQEPPYMFVIDLLTPDLQFYDSVKDYEIWLKWITATEPADVVKLVRK